MNSDWRTQARESVARHRAAQAVEERLLTALTLGMPMDLKYARTLVDCVLAVHAGALEDLLHDRPTPAQFHQFLGSDRCTKLVRRLTEEHDTGVSE